MQLIAKALISPSTMTWWGVSTQLNATKVKTSKNDILQNCSTTKTLKLARIKLHLLLFGNRLPSKMVKRLARTLKKLASSRSSKAEWVSTTLGNSIAVENLACATVASAASASLATKPWRTESSTKPEKDYWLRSTLQTLSNNCAFQMPWCKWIWSNIRSVWCAGTEPTVSGTSMIYMMS